MKDTKSTIIQNHFNSIAPTRKQWRQKSWYYHAMLTKFYQHHIPVGSRVLELGCGTGELLGALKPSYGVGLDVSEKLISIARKQFPKYRFIVGNAQSLPIAEPFDYVILSDLVGSLADVQKTFEELRKVASHKTRIIVVHHNHLWEPFIWAAERFGLKMPQPEQNWLSTRDIENLFYLSNLDVVRSGMFLLLPTNIPFISSWVNQFVAPLPIFNSLCLVKYVVARLNPSGLPAKDYSVSLIVPARNERGNIENVVRQIPKLGSSTEIIFVESQSRDGTYEEIKRVAKKYELAIDIRYVRSGTTGKGAAVRIGFDKAKGDICIIFDADLTVSANQLPKFYHAIRTGKGELVIGSRLVYPMEKEAMRFLNKLGNKFFSLAFTFLLGQYINDTLCGTKAIWKKDYDKIARNRKYFGDFDPYSDFDLIFGATKLDMKIAQIPITYLARTYGKSNITRFRHGFLLAKMTIFAANKIKFV